MSSQSAAQNNGPLSDFPLHLFLPEHRKLRSSYVMREATRKALIRRVQMQHRGTAPLEVWDTLRKVTVAALRDENLARFTPRLLPSGLLRHLVHGECLVYSDRDRAIMFLSCCMLCWSAGSEVEERLSNWLDLFLQGLVAEQWEANPRVLPLLPEVQDPELQRQFAEPNYVIHLPQAAIPVLLYRVPDSAQSAYGALVPANSANDLHFDSAPGVYALRDLRFSQDDIELGLEYIQPLCDAVFAEYTSDPAKIEILTNLAITDLFLGSLLNTCVSFSHSEAEDEADYDGDDEGDDEANNEVDDEAEDEVNDEAEDEVEDEIEDETPSRAYFVLGWLRHKLLLQPLRAQLLDEAFRCFFHSVLDRVWRHSFPELEVPLRLDELEQPGAKPLSALDYEFILPSDGTILCAPQSGDDND